MAVPSIDNFEVQTSFSTINSYFPLRISQWPSRDPIEESGGVNLYNFVGNNPLSKWDILGQKWKKKKTINDGARRLWERTSKMDTLAKLAEKVKLDPNEAAKWAKKEDAGGCSYSVPRIYIVADILRAKHFGGRFVNLGGRLGNFFTQGDFKKIKVKQAAQVLAKINEHSGDIWGFVLFTHGAPDGQLYTGVKNAVAWSNSANIIDALKGNGFKLSKLYAMQCYSGYVGKISEIYRGTNLTPGNYNWKPKWAALYHHKGRTYQYINAALFDVNLDGLNPQTGKFKGHE